MDEQDVADFDKGIWETNAVSVSYSCEVGYLPPTSSRNSNGIVMSSDTLQYLLNTTVLAFNKDEYCSTNLYGRLTFDW